MLIPYIDNDVYQFQNLSSINSMLNEPRQHKRYRFPKEAKG